LSTITEPRATGAPSAADYPSRGYAWYVVFVLYLAYVLAFVDRQIMTFMVQPIRSEFGITDFEFSMVHGFGFVIFYSVLGIPIARLADRYSRRNIAAVGVGLWSLMTAACGLAGSYMQLFLARLGVGVGEASISPSAISLISDYFPPDKRALPINLYSSGVTGGAGLANIFGGMVVGFTMAGGVHSLPILGEMRAWQVAFVLVGLPGVLIALLLLTVREPKRQERKAEVVQVSIRDALRYLRTHWTAYAGVMVAAGFAAMANYGAFSWVPALYDRVYGWGPAEIGTKFGIITIIAGTAGLWGSGVAVRKLAQAGVSAPHIKIMIVATILSVPPAALLMAVHDPYWTLACLSLITLLMCTPIGLAQGAIAAITPNELRAQLIAVYLLVTAFLGMGAGPNGVAAITDFVYKNDAAVGSSIAFLATGACVVSIIILIIAIKPYARKAGADAVMG